MKQYLKFLALDFSVAKASIFLARLQLCCYAFDFFNWLEAYWREGVYWAIHWRKSCHNQVCYLGFWDVAICVVNFFTAAGLSPIQFGLIFEIIKDRTWLCFAAFGGWFAGSYFCASKKSKVFWPLLLWPVKICFQVILDEQSIVAAYFF